ncbi:hypothetical protein FHG89_12395 [Micromonospora orduensis]|uniref:Uncharacterized protein n=1 Tax=Micromonospora orduensis TaxID=1420891 RepID=A0A5C4QQV7_9ACTN|nr:hypothetical protein [Micromonospora orduensis]TNH29455.1 hypothetical protein FHG89_12395 [Micromonospora orduensis]
MPDTPKTPDATLARPTVEVEARMIRSGEVLRLTREASPQFARAITVRVIRVLAERHTYHGWVWIECYELGRNGDAVARRELFLMPAGAHRLAGTPVPRGRRPVVPRRVAV